ncbi:MAG: glycosyltransferase family 2 protein [Lentimicrobiaceae bacterium]|nr:glycosyltransferase family 2 protein [Lentimicrobiaceae bacterium]
MKVSLIINTYNRWTYVRTLLKALKKQDYKDFEVILVNGPSTDDTYMVREYYSTVKYRQIKQRNISISRNAGIEMARGDVIIFIDDDALPCDSRWITRFVEAFKQDDKLAALAGPVKVGESERYEFYRNFSNDYGKEFYIWPHTVDLDENKITGRYPFERGQGCNMAFRTNELLGIGGFDEYFKYFLDETDVFCRLHKKGLRVKNLTDNFVRHFRGPSTVRGDGHNLKWSRFGRSTSYYGMKNGSDKLPGKMLKIMKVLKATKSADLISFYRNKEISFLHLCKYLIKYYGGGGIGIYDSLFKSRRFLRKNRILEINAYVRFI